MRPTYPCPRPVRGAERLRTVKHLFQAEDEATSGRNGVPSSATQGRPARLVSTCLTDTRWIPCRLQREAQRRLRATMIRGFVHGHPCRKYIVA